VRRLQLTAADVLAVGVGGAVAFTFTLALAEAWLRRAARR
jgi:hypothetical protein